MKKKMVAIITAAACVLALAACGNSGAGSSGSSASSAGSQAVSEASSASQSSAASSASSASSAPSASEVSSASAASSASETSSASAASSASEAASETSEYESTLTEEDEALLAIPVVDEELDPADCVELCDYSKVDVKDAYVAPTDADVQSYIDSLLTAVEVEDENAVVGDGDTANINYVGKLDGEAFEGGTGDNYDLIIGSGTFIEGFEDGVIGMKKGEVKDIELTFPEDYWNEDMAGKQVVFTVTLNSIKQVPEFNDEWVKNYSETEETTVDGFKKYVADMLEENARTTALQNEQMEILTYVEDNSTVTKIPKSYVDLAESNFDSANEAQAQAYGMTITELLEASGLTQEYYDEQKLIASRESAKNNLLYDALWAKEGLTEKSEEYQNAMKELEKAYSLSVEELNAQYGEEVINNYGKAFALLERLFKYANVVPAEEAETTQASSAGEVQTTSSSNN